ncbi:carbohydrate kinase [Quadrisphaera sp. DSM 44207]|uniref:carbohydrate kinase family protein n=1 Tax=Quadrisphaera sp. DSM 44207 TaxID=1881057 RepID=UPI00087FD7BA|nr:carbohydrate kinase [Quadrisphaera sp. DSM 44207]SDQ69735.1 fructokinase [Quadrisphaera sp. DSM 44207]
MGGVLVIGEALVDVVVPVDGEAVEHPGGSPANVALGLARLGRETHLLTHLGDDGRGEAVRRHLEASGVQLVEGSVQPGRTSTAEAALAADGSATYAFDLTWSLPRTPLPQAPLAVHTGSIAAVLQPGAATVERIMAGASGDATTSYDPNLRPDLMGEPAAVRAPVEALVAVSDVVKLSEEDAAWLVPGTAPEELAAAWLRLGPAVVVLTRGADGMVALCRAGRVEVPAERVRVADTVGAGDSAMAALLDGLWEHGLLGGPAREALAGIGTGVLQDVVRRAVRAAAITVSRPGADPPTRAELG